MQSSGTSEEARLEHNRISLASHHKNRDERNARRRKRYAANRDQQIAYWRNWRKEKGEKAAGRQRPDKCEICGRKGKYELHFDHCHTTGKFRGWLCNKCNTVLGLMEDNGDWLMRLSAYARHGGMTRFLRKVA